VIDIFNHIIGWIKRPFMMLKQFIIDRICMHKLSQCEKNIKRCYGDINGADDKTFLRRLPEVTNLIERCIFITEDMILHKIISDKDMATVRSVQKEMCILWSNLRTRKCHIENIQGGHYEY